MGSAYAIGIGVQWIMGSGLGFGIAIAILLKIIFDYFERKRNG
jgi:hypothetical protein